jgi:hypothetical protein
MIGLEPDDQRDFGSWKDGNLSGNPSTAPRCGAKTRRGLPCKAPAMRSRKSGEYTRCRLHGGASTGPKTSEGLERCRLARLKHGLRSAAAVQQRKQDVAERKQCREELAHLYKS